MPKSLAELVVERRKALGLSHAELAERLPYRDPLHGSVRLRLLEEGELEGFGRVFPKLAEVLGCSQNEIDAGIDEQTRRNIEALEERWRLAVRNGKEQFSPHAIILTEQTVPTQITLYGMMGIERVRRIEFPADLDPADAPLFAVTEMKKRLAEYKGSVPFLGEPCGIAINYGYDDCLVIDVEGRNVRRVNRAYVQGHSMVWWKR